MYLVTSDYLLPDRYGLTIPEKQELFSFRNRMFLIHENFEKMGLPEHCICGENENITHIYTCDILNPDPHILPYKYILNGNIHEQISVYKRMQISMKTRQEYIDIYNSM